MNEIKFVKNKTKKLMNYPFFISTDEKRATKSKNKIKRKESEAIKILIRSR